MHWFLLYVAIGLEVAGTTALKLSDGLTRWGAFATALGLYAVSFGLLAVTLRQLPVSVAYAVWAGVGTLLVSAIGIVALGEGLTPARAAFIAMIIAGAVGLHLTTGEG